MAEYTGPSTTNEAVVIANGIAGRIVPDTYGTGDDDKYSDPHYKFIHPDPYARYGDDSAESGPRDRC